MTLLYKAEHTRCFNYEKGTSPIVEKKLLLNNQRWDIESIMNKMIYVAEGECEFSYNQYSNKSVSEKEMIIMPAGATVVVNAKKNSKIFTLRLDDIKNLCECFSLDMLLREETEDEEHTDHSFCLEANERIIAFFEQWEFLIDDALLCKYFLTLKTNELFYLLRAYHTKEDLLKFFYPVLSNDMTFSDFVMRNHFKVRTVNELADMANYSLSGFQKRFKKVFGVSAYNWMKKEKLKSVFHEITNTSHTFKEISNKFGFSSPSHFNDFCKSNFGHTPGILRKNKINARILKE